MRPRQWWESVHNGTVTIQPGATLIVDTLVVIHDPCAQIINNGGTLIIPQQSTQWLIRIWTPTAMTRKRIGTRNKRVWTCSILRPFWKF